MTFTFDGGRWGREIVPTKNKEILLFYFYKLSVHIWGAIHRYSIDLCVAP